MSEADFTSGGPGTLATARVAIVGLGLMGGSLAMALRGHCARLLGVDPDEATLSLARGREVVDLASSDPAEILPQADVVILAAPVRAILQLVEALPALHPGGAIVLDLGSTKVEIAGAMARLPARFDPLGGHPMCGKEHASLANAEPGLFQGAPFAFSPLPNTSERARSLVVQLSQVIGARPVWLDAETHDRWVAATSHLPYLLASALAIATRPEFAPLVGPGFRSTARLAATSPAMMLEVLASNRENVLAALAGFREQLDELAGSLAREDIDSLRQRLEHGSALHKALIEGYPMGGSL